jgi:hypothetical protein
MTMLVSTPLSPTAQARLDRELAIGEKVIWSAQPVAARIAPGVFAATAIGVLLAALAAAVATMAAVTLRAEQAAPFVAILGAVGLGAGALLIVLPRVFARRLDATVYAITDRRAISVTPGWGAMPETTRSFAPSALGMIARRERADGSGDLVFDEVFVPGSVYRTAGFLAIADVRRVEQVLRATLLA